jgi:hypothetical protein
MRNKIFLGLHILERLESVELFFQLLAGQKEVSTVVGLLP